MASSTKKTNTNGSQTTLTQNTNPGAARPLPPVRFDDVMRPPPQPQRPGKPQNTPPAA